MVSGKVQADENPYGFLIEAGKFSGRETVRKNDDYVYRVWKVPEGVYAYLLLMGEPPGEHSGLVWGKAKERAGWRAPIYTNGSIWYNRRDKQYFVYLTRHCPDLNRIHDKDDRWYLVQTEKQLDEEMGRAQRRTISIRGQKGHAARPRLRRRAKA